MIRVYVREENDSEGYLLGEFELQALPELKKSLWINDVYMYDSGNMYESPTVTGNYVYGEKNGIHYELVIEDSQDAQNPPPLSSPQPQPQQPPRVAGFAQAEADQGSTTTNKDGYMKNNFSGSGGIMEVARR